MANFNMLHKYRYSSHFSRTTILWLDKHKNENSNKIRFYNILK